MKAFRFRLEAVLTLREQAEQAAQQACARAYAAVEAAAAQVRAVGEAIAAAQQAHLLELANAPRADQIEHIRTYISHLQERQSLLERALAEARRRADAACRQLIVATQQREGLERVRLRQHRAHAYATARLEQSVLDECVGRRPGTERGIPEGQHL